MFKNYDNWLVELNLAQARKATEIFLKSGGKERYNEIFNGQDRIYYDFKSSKEITSKVLDEVAGFLAKEGYILIDYIQGTCYLKTDVRRTLKVQRILYKLGNEKLAQLMNNDPIRDSSKTSGFKVVISRHGIDLAGQSTDRDWSSCKTLTSGMNARYVWTEIEAGALVAYLIKSDDTNIQKPIARQTMAVFRMKDSDKVAFYPTSSVYGNYRNSDFKDFVLNWCIEANAKINATPGEYFMDIACHSDIGQPNLDLVGGKTSLKDYIKHRIADEYTTKRMVIGDVEIEDLEENFFDEISKLNYKDAERFSKSSGLKSSTIANIFEKGVLEDMERTYEENPKTISILITECAKDWKKISKKRMVEIYDIFEKDNGKEGMEDILAHASSTASLFLKQAYAEKYK